MKKLYTNIICFLMISNASLAQQQVGLAQQSALERQNKRESFLRFEIPAVINGSNLSPSPESNISINFTDSEFSAQYGFPGPKKTHNKIEQAKTKSLVKQDTNYFKVTGFIKGTFIATDGIVSLYKDKKFANGVSLSAGVSRIFYNNKKYNLTEPLWWINARASLNRSQYNLIDTNSINQILKEETQLNGSFIVSINRYFHSDLPGYKWMNLIWSLGAGYVSTNNYEDLPKRIHESGNIYFSADSSKIQTVTSTTTGRIDNFQRYEGVALYGEAYKPIRRRATGLNLYFGLRASSFEVLSARKIFNASGGLFFNIKKSKSELKPGQEKAEDKVNFAIIARSNQFNEIIEGEKQFKEKFDIVLTASVPIRFN